MPHEERENEKVISNTNDKMNFELIFELNFIVVEFIGKMELGFLV